MNKTQIIEQLKTEYPALTKGINDEVIELDSTEYEATIDAWADAVIAKAVKKAEAEAQAAAKESLLDRLGITADEAKLLLS